MVVVLVNQASNVAKLVDMARDGDGAFMVESELFLGLLQELHEEWVGDVDDRDHKPLLLFPLTNQDRQTSLGNIFHLLVSLLMKVKPMKMKMKVQVLFVANNPHFLISKV
ncbi:hypothetical protein V6N13_073788 [Hibiscus sabdariffa]